MDWCFKCIVARTVDTKYQNTVNQKFGSMKDTPSVMSAIVKMNMK